MLLTPTYRHTPLVKPASLPYLHTTQPRLKQMEAMDTSSTECKPGRWKQIGNEEKKAAVHEEMNRMNQLPATSSYVTHRLRVLNKILELMSIQRSVSQDEELELLFAGLHL